MTTLVSIKHSFEAGHRLPILPGKCQSLHGHSWTVEVSVAAPEPDDRGIVANFTDLKRGLREWIDDRLDHGLMLGYEDPLLVEPIALQHRGKVFIFGGGWNGGLRDLAWPTVENVATLIARKAQELLVGLEKAEGAYVAQVIVSETSTNSATWEAPLPAAEIVSIGDMTVNATLRIAKLEFDPDWAERNATLEFDDVDGGEAR